MGLYKNKHICSAFAWESEAVTHVGKVRKVNEDSFLESPSQAHWVVADGMGGHSLGDYASQKIVEELGQLVQAEDFTSFIDDVENTLLAINSHLQQKAYRQDSIIGSTVAGLVFHGNVAFFYWAGDSRIYRLRSDYLVQLSTDHTVVQEMLHKGEISVEESQTHPDKNIITRAVGADNELFVEFSHERIESGDIFLICSDGLEKEMSDSEVKDILNHSNSNLKNISKSLLDTVLDRGARDNTTIVLVKAQSI